MKRFVAVFMAMLLVTALYACGGNTDDAGSSTTGSTTSTTAATTSPTSVGGFVKPAGYASVVTVTINPQFRLYLDAAGEVLAVEPVNTDAKGVADKITVKAGAVKAVVESLVTAVNDGGFVKENATVDIAVTEIADTVSADAVLTAVKEAAVDSFEAIEVAVEVKTTVPSDVTTITTTTTAAGTTTSTEAATTTTTKTSTTTTTKVSYSAFKKYDWQFRVIVEQEGAKFCATYTLILQEGKLRIGTSTASPYEEMVPPEYRDEEKPSFSFGGIDWYEGAGGFGSMTSAVEKNNTLTFTGDGDLKLNIVLVRTGETTAKVTATNLPFPIKVGDVFNGITPTPIQDEEPEPEGDYTPVAEKGGAWMGGYKAKDGTYRLVTLVLCGDAPNLDMAIGDPLSGFPEDVQPDVKPDCEEYGGEFYYFGRGDGGAIPEIAENGTTVEIRDENGSKMYLKRTDENTFKIDGCSNRFAGMEDFPNDMVFTFAAEQ
ncbi:MAG: hypothetical protein E7534_01020 [Ruminococcaceae bacterium]|nr:hypothetical protein [Oscillospiraceae bacterium]